MTIKNMPHVTVEQVLALRDAAIELEQERDELAAQVERLRKLIMDKTAQLRCCNSPYYDNETSPICCGTPDFTWPDDVVSVLSETPPAALAALKAQWQADAVRGLITNISGAIENDYISMKEIEEMDIEDFCNLAEKHANKLESQVERLRGIVKETKL